MTQIIRKALASAFRMSICFAYLSLANEKNDVTYDYIIVGGGTAGAALATRLSQGLPDYSILLIEAGPAVANDPKVDIPALRGSGIGGPLDWNFTSVPQSQAADRLISVPRGKVLGGSSALNFMLWNRASLAEYDAWEELGNPNWNWDSISQSMVKSENFTNLNLTEAGDDVRGINGPIHSTISRYIPESQHLYRSAMENIGLARNIDSLNGHPLGVAFQPSSIDTVDWKRSYAANSYIPQAGSNLEKLLSTRVARVNLDGSEEANFTATGVTLEDGTVIHARNEVILSAGSLQSPGLLEISGIGQKGVLDAAGISQLVELPGVGENLQDHIRVQLVWQLKDNYTSLDKLIYNTTFAAEQLALWEDRQYSIYDELPNGISFLNYKQAFGNDSTLVDLAEQEFGNSTSVVDQKKLDFLSDDSVAKIEIVYLDGYLGSNSYPGPDSPDYGNNYLTLVSALMHSLGRGSVHIKSTNISVTPLLDLRFLSNEHDLQALVEIGKLARKIGQTEPLASIVTSEYEPGLDSVDSDEEWVEFVKDTSLSFFHVAGTCAMLPRGDGGVVDPTLKVWGTKNLRVVDASIIPVLIASHTQTAVYGIAERAAQIIIDAV